MLWTIILLSLLGFLYYKVCYQPLQYWNRKKVRQGAAIPFFGDSFQTLFKLETLIDLIHRLYRKGNERLYGVYQMQIPILMIKDVDLLKQITVKDFDHFSDHRSFLPEHSEPLWNKNLLALKGNPWHEMRATLSPAFTRSKMKAMFDLMNGCAEQFINFNLNKNERVVTLELKDSFTRYSNDVIANCAFGVRCDSLKERDNEFYLMGKEATNLLGNFWKTMKMFIYFLLPISAKVLRIRVFSEEVCQFFIELVKSTIKVREEQKIVRPDMINILMDAKKGQLKHENEEVEHDVGFATVEESHIGKVQKVHKTEVTYMDITAQALIFFFAGFDTVSTLMTFMSYELAVNPEIQVKLVAEVIETRKACNGKINYEDLAKMKYMDMVITETLRKWPPFVAVDRICTKPYVIQSVDNEPSVSLNTGDILWIPIVSIHHDPKYYSKPESFDPERFNDKNKKNIYPFAFLPFGIGPRNCIASRFALLETKVVFYHILSHFDITLVEKTVIPIKIQKGKFNLSPDGGCWVGLKRRE